MRIFGSAQSAFWPRRGRPLLFLATLAFSGCAHGGGFDTTRVEVVELKNLIPISIEPGRTIAVIQSQFLPDSTGSSILPFPFADCVSQFLHEINPELGQVAASDLPNTRQVRWSDDVQSQLRRPEVKAEHERTNLKYIVIMDHNENAFMDGLGDTLVCVTVSCEYRGKSRARVYDVDQEAWALEMLVSSRARIWAPTALIMIPVPILSGEPLAESCERLARKLNDEFSI